MNLVDQDADQNTFPRRRGDNSQESQLRRKEGQAGIQVRYVSREGEVCVDKKETCVEMTPCEEVETVRASELPSSFMG